MPETYDYICVEDASNLLFQPGTYILRAKFIFESGIENFRSNRSHLSEVYIDELRKTGDAAGRR